MSDFCSDACDSITSGLRYCTVWTDSPVYHNMYRQSCFTTICTGGPVHHGMALFTTVCTGSPVYRSMYRQPRLPWYVLLALFSAACRTGTFNLCGTVTAAQNRDDNTMRNYSEYIIALHYLQYGNRIKLCVCRMCRDCLAGLNDSSHPKADSRTQQVTKIVNCTVLVMAVSHMFLFPFSPLGSVLLSCRDCSAIQQGLFCYIVGTADGVWLTRGLQKLVALVPKPTNVNLLKVSMRTSSLD